MAELQNEQRIFIVRCLAHFMTPSEIVEAVKEEFEGLEIDRQQVRHYNPEQSTAIASEWREMFQREREVFLSDLRRIPIANQAVRLRDLNQVREHAKRKKLWSLLSKVNEQAAKEVGGAFTNKSEQKVDGKIEVELTPTVTDYRQAVAPLAPPPDDAG